ncbi:glutaredoxin family protein [Bacillaceae bacterium W0354]
MESFDRGVTLYTTDHCKKSEQLRNLFKEWGVTFKEKNTSKNKAFLKELQNLGIYGTPTTFIGDQFIEGLQKDRLYKILKDK